MTVVTVLSSLVVLAAAPSGAAGSPGAPTASADRIADEREPHGVRGLDDQPETAQRLTTAIAVGGKAARAAVRGMVSPASQRTRAIAPNREDDGSIGTARDPGEPGITTTGTIGDAPAERNGDFDFYQVDAAAGDTIVVRVVSRSDGFDPALILYDAAGHPVGENDERINDTDPVLVFPVAHPGPYFAMVAGSGSRLADPFKAGSGTGATSTGSYAITAISAAADVDVYGVHLHRGDVLGVSLDGAGDRLALLGPGGGLIQGSGGAGSALYPTASPLPRGRITVDHVAATDGWHYVSVTGRAGAYRLDVAVAAAGPARAQTVFLDFDGASIDPAIFAASGLPTPEPPGPRALAPLRSFRAAWGLTAAAEVPLEHAIVRTVRAELESVHVVGSDSDPDPFGRTDVSRVVVGGTIAATGLPTIGIGESVDPGNFATSETAVVLLDTLSAPASEPYSANAYLTPGSDRVRFVGEVLGAYVAHEIGHLLGCWHTEPTAGAQGLMDSTNIARIIAGPDRAGGTPDDVHLDFASANHYLGFEGLTGTEDTEWRTRTSASH